MLKFIDGGVCAAHPINNGLAELSATHPYYHGEKVAFALLCQLILENAPRETLEQVLAFHTHVGLPVTLLAARLLEQGWMTPDAAQGS